MVSLEYWLISASNRAAERGSWQTDSTAINYLRNWQYTVKGINWEYQRTAEQSHESWTHDYLVEVQTLIHRQKNMQNLYSDVRHF